MKKCIFILQEHIHLLQNVALTNNVAVAEDHLDSSRLI